MLFLGLISLETQALETDKPFRDFVVDQWDVKEGLPQITVLAITQDTNGYLWFGTQAGLARFDGVHFHRYTAENAPNLNANIQALHADRQGRLWIGTARGLIRFEQGQFKKISHPKDGLDFSIRAITSTPHALYIAGPDGLYSSQGDQLRRQYAIPSGALNLLNHGDDLWIGSAGQVFLLRNNTLRAFPLPESASGIPITSLAWFEGELWAGSSRGLFRLHQDKWLPASTRINQTTPTVEAMLSDHNGTLWVATTQALERLRPGQPTEHIRNAPGTISLRTLFEDSDGNLWMGSQTEGVARFWNGYTRRLDTAYGLANPLTWSLAKAPNGGTWFATGDGVAQWRNGRFTQVIQGTQLPHPEAYSLFAEANQLWIGTRAGVALFRDGHVETPAPLAPMRNTQINDIVRDQQQRLWFATTKGLFLLNPSNKLTLYGERSGFTDTRIRVVYETRDGRILVGATRGLFEWRDGQIIPLGRNTGLEEDIAVTSILELSDGRWLIGSSTGDGLHLFDGKRWTALGSDNNLPVIIPFYVGESGDDLWVAGMQGVYRLAMTELNKAQANPRAQLRAQIIINSGFERPGGQTDKCCNGSGGGRGLIQDGQLWLPTRDGALLVNLNAAQPKATHPVQIESIDIDNRTLLATHAVIHFPIDARSPKFNFAAPAFQPAQVPLLRYKLEGYDNEWRSLETPSQRSASYSNLPPGDYVFKVADFNTDNPLLSEARIDIEVPAHVYETLAFRILVGLIIIALIWLAYLGLRFRYTRQRELLEQLVRERTQELQIANRKLQEISFTDHLTGLHNRRYLAQQIPVDSSFYERDANYRNGNDAAVFILLDIDHFKAINDTWGHAAGDLVLQQFAELLESIKRSGDYVARWGGEEFLLVLRPLPRGSLAQIGQRLCDKVGEKEFDLGNGVRRHITISAGLVESPLFPDRHHQLLSWEQLVTLADHAMYQVKISGRNGWLACRPVPGAHFPEGDRIFNGNPDALLDRGILELYGREGRITPSARQGRPSPQPQAPD